MISDNRELRRRGGFTLLEVVITLVILAGIAGILVPEVLGRLQSGQAATMSQNLTNVSTAIHGFRSDVGRYPSRVSHLATKPASGTDVCGNAIPALLWEEWSGPYLARSVPATGLPIGASTLLDTLSKSGTSAAPILVITVRQVDREVADEIEASFDGNADPNGGTIRWTDQGGGRGDLLYHIPIRGC